LSADVAIDEFKNKVLGNDENPNDEGYLGPIVPSPIRNWLWKDGGPKTYLPGWREDGGVDFEW
jgi:hypothetical protein